MTKVPTTTAMMAKTSRKIVMNDSWSLRSDWLSSVICLPVSTSRPLSPSALSCSSTERTTSACETPWSATTPMLSNLPGSPTSRCASSVVHSA